MISQEDMKAIFLPLLREQGQIFMKKQKVWAKPANEGEIIITMTADGMETSNVAKQGDMLVKNQTDAEEIYVVSAKSFEERYVKIEDTIFDNAGFEEFKPIGKIYVLVIGNQLLTKLKLPKSFYFEAPWEANMICKENDCLASPPDFSQVYRIARKEFFETYASVNA